MPLQKSFSEQNYSSTRGQQQWARNKSYQGTSRDDSRPTKHLQEKEPIPISLTTKNKLNTFQFTSNSESKVLDTMSYTSGSALDNKENEGIPQKQPNRQKGGTGETEQKKILESMTKPSPKQLSQTKARRLGRGSPATPAGKLCMKDLTGMTDLEVVAKEESPVEILTWHSSGQKREIGNRRKRARSSSPSHSSSPLQHGFDLHRLSQSLETPCKGAELASSGPDFLQPRDGREKRPRLALAALIQSSSPQRRKGGHTPRGLTRAGSTPKDWPSRYPNKNGAHINNDISKTPTSLARPFLGKLGRQESNLSTSHLSSSLAPPNPDVSEADSPLHSSLQVDDPTSTLMEVPIDEDPLPQAFGGNNDAGVKSASFDFAEEFEGIDVADFDMLVAQSQPVLPRADPDSRYTANQQAKATTSATTARAAPPPVGSRPAAYERQGMVDPLSQSHAVAVVGEDDFGDEFDDEMLAIAQRYDTIPVTKDTSATSSNTLAEAGASTGKIDSDDYDDGFDEDDFELAAAATQYLQDSIGSMPPSTQKARAIQRYLVTNVVETDYTNDKGKPRPQKVLLVQVEHTKEVRSIVLRDEWYETSATVNAYVHVIGDFKGQQIVINRLQNIIILHPDQLLSSTVVADSFSCTRRAVLQDRVKSTSDTSAALVYGTILHEIFQAAMIANRWDTMWLNETIETITTRHLEDLYKIKLQIPHAVEYLQSKMNELQSWADLFLSAQPKPDAIVKAQNGNTATMCVSKLLDVEEHVWSPMYGLKGNIDATVQVTMQDGKEQRILTVPFEVKTGKTANAAHRAQTALYNLLLSDRYDVEIAYGILYYMETSETIRIPAIRHELLHMIMKRNELACFVRERHAQLPPMLKKESLCNRCYAKTTCFIYHRLADDGTGESSGMKEKFDAVVKHLTPRHKEFFLKWDDLLTKEEKESLKFRRELWTMLSSEREKLGRCFSNVIIEPGSAYEEQNNPKINRYRYTMIKENLSAGFSFIESQITIGEPIVISDEKGHFALANGYVTHVRKDRITVAVDRRLHNARIRKAGFNETTNQAFASIMEVAGEGATPEASLGKIKDKPVQYRLDKDEFSNGMATVRNNLLQVMTDGIFGSREIRGLIVDLNAPQFKAQSTQYRLHDQASINIDQRKAIEKVMSARDYALVLGMPGTGKTTTIAHIIRALVSQGKSVLLTSYTHTAVDNILLKLKDDKIPILRLGTIAKVNAEVQEFAILAAKPQSSFEDIRSAWHDSPIVATTCLGINHAIFSERTFDYCIVDEASQITLPVCLGPIRMARTFILVGDHYQLPPLVQNEDARTGGLDISLFKLLSDTHPSSVVNLEHQYRMCEDIMLLSNNLIYNGRLKCGTSEVANRSIHIPNMKGLKAHHFTSTTMPRTQRSFCRGSSSGNCWIRDLLEPQVKVRFINTDTLLPLSREEAKGNRIVNQTEARICTQLVESLLSVGVPADSIGVMTHYRSQLALLKHGLRNHPDVEMHTADRFQGRDKEVVILSLVRSNEARSIGELLKDWRRINVAFTRAKTKLLVIGSSDTLKGNTNNNNGVKTENGNGNGSSNNSEMVSKFVSLMEQKGWVFNMPQDALDSHIFQDSATQATADLGCPPPSNTDWKPIMSNKHGACGEQNEACKRTGYGNAFPQTNVLQQQLRDKREPKRTTRVGERAVLAGKVIMRDVMNELVDG